LNGSIVVDGEGESTTHFGLPVTHQLIHPNHMLVMDEMGINMNQKEDGHVGSEKYLCEQGTTPKIAVSTTNHHCTIILIIAASGEAVCCVVIFKGDSQSPFADWCLGIDVTVVPEKDVRQTFFVECNTGAGKYRPGGPTCFF